MCRFVGREHSTAPRYARAGVLLLIVRLKHIALILLLISHSSNHQNRTMFGIFKIKKKKTETRISALERGRMNRKIKNVKRYGNTKYLVLRVLSESFDIPITFLFCYNLLAK